MLLYFGSIAALAALVLGVCLLDGDFSEGGLFAEMAKQARAKPLGNLTSHTIGPLADAKRPPPRGAYD
jgi:hypothetical protein